MCSQNSHLRLQVPSVPNSYCFCTLQFGSMHLLRVNSKDLKIDKKRKNIIPCNICLWIKTITYLNYQTGNLLQEKEVLFYNRGRLNCLSLKANSDNKISNIYLNINVSIKRSKK